MFQSIWQDIQQQFRFGNRVTQLIIVNVIVFVVFGFLKLISRGVDGGGFANEAVNFFAFSSDWYHNLTHPWSILTYAFMHAGLGHIFWNMILFYWFGRIVGDLIGDKYIFPLYFLGAVAGGLLYWGISALFSFTSGVYMVGASASVMAFIVAAAFYAPEYSFRLILIGEVRLKYIALAIILIDLFAFGTDGNTGGHIAHIGGMAMGYVFVTALGSGYDLAAPINNTIDGLSDLFDRLNRKAPPRRPAPRTTSRSRTSVASYETTRRGNSTITTTRSTPTAGSHQEQLDVILEKIKASGIKSLSAEEREFLSHVSRES